MRIIKTTKNNICCHPAAQDAFLFNKNQKKQFSNIISELKRTQLKLIKPLPVVVMDSNKYQFVSDWEYIDLHNKNIEAIYFNKPLLDEEIEVIAWDYVIRTYGLSLHRKTCFKTIHDLLNQLPSSFGIQNKSINPLIQKIANESRSTIRHQIDKLKSVHNKESLFEEIIND